MRHARDVEPPAGLRQLKAGVAGDGVAQFVAQRRLLVVVGQLEEVEASGGGGEATDRVVATDVEEPLEDAAHRVTRVLP